MNVATNWPALRSPIPRPGSASITRSPASTTPATSSAVGSRSRSGVATRLAPPRRSAAAWPPESGRSGRAAKLGRGNGRALGALGRLLQFPAAPIEDFNHAGEPPRRRLLNPDLTLVHPSEGVPSREQRGLRREG